MCRLSLRFRGALLSIVSALLFAMSGAIVQPGSAVADSFLPAGGGWQTYVNDRFGTSFAFPADIFTPSAPPENGDGRRFVAEDATLEVYAWHNIDDENARTLKRRLVGSDGYTDVTYSPSGRSWLVLSGYRGDNIFYEKYFFRGDTVHGFGIEFPAGEKPYYAPIIERIENSFHAG